MSGWDLPYRTEIAVRLRDLDPMGHVNNAVYATYFEEAREDYFADVLGKGRLADLNTVTVTQRIDYREPIPADRDAVVVRAGVVDIGEKSLDLHYEIRLDGTTAATAETVQVVYDTNSEETRPVPSEWRSRIEDYQSRERSAD
ncbi:MAG: acyl-CoA thioesterase [Halobacteriales archaeon]